MTDITTKPYWAITGLGWGRGETTEEALANYRSIQRRNFPKLTEADLDEVWGFVWKAPEGADGFSLDSRLWWKFEDGSTVEADVSQRVHTIGNVPVSMISNTEGR